LSRNSPVVERVGGVHVPAFNSASVWARMPYLRVNKAKIENAGIRSVVKHAIE
jgi:hypothetical protein